MASRTALLAVALAVQIFGPKEPVTVATLSMEVLAIILLVFMGMRVMQFFSRNDDGRDGDASTGKNSDPTGEIGLLFLTCSWM